ncbi:HTH_Tnp_Tc3_2 domain-containing protein [Trichonephila clavipes]|nr:HTH_Tnp_Tc3_2 domain-containing protein [Trichonephila clavipes]
MEADVARISTLKKVWDELAYRLDLCRVRNGANPFNCIESNLKPICENIGIMTKLSYLPENKRYKIIHLKEEGYSMYQIAAKVPCGLSTVVKTLKRFSETNFIVDRGQSGRPRKASLREDRLLHRISLSNRKLNSPHILKQWTLTSNVSVCTRTVRGRLLEIGLRGCKACPKPLLTAFQRKR